MDVSSEPAEPSWADNKRARLFASYLPIALAAAGCVAAIAIVLQAQDLTIQRSAWERDAPTREQLKEEDSTIDRRLADRRHERDDLEAQLKALRQNASTAQSNLDKALADKGKTDAERAATQAQLDTLRQQLDEAQKRLSGVKDDLTRGGADLTNLNDQQGKLKLSVQQLTNDQTRLQGETKQLDTVNKSMTQQGGALASDIDGARTQLSQLKQSFADQQADTERFRRQGEDLRKELDDLTKQRITLASQIQDLQGKAASLKPLGEQAAQLDRKVADLDAQRQGLEQTVKSLQQQKDDTTNSLKAVKAELDAQRQGLEQTVKSLQQQKDDAAARLKTANDDLDAVKDDLRRTTEQLNRTTEQLKGLEGGRGEVRLLQAQREELERMIVERRKSLESTRPVPPSDPTPRPSPAPDQTPPPGR